MISCEASILFVAPQLLLASLLLGSFVLLSFESVFVLACVPTGVLSSLHAFMALALAIGSATAYIVAVIPTIDGFPFVFYQSGHGYRINNFFYYLTIRI
jgi:hypothetical protein